MLLSVPHDHDFGELVVRGFGGVDAVFNARDLVCGCVNGAWKFTPHAPVMHLENKRVKAHMTHVWINYNAHCKSARAFGFGEGRGSTCPFGTHLVDGGVWNAWLCTFANHTPSNAWHASKIGLVNQLK
jgi:hypothetical protein